jgi:hypothetical protein
VACGVKTTRAIARKELIMLRRIILGTAFALALTLGALAAAFAQPASQQPAAIESGV